MTITPAAPSAASLPLDWTQISRRRRRPSAGASAEEDRADAVRPDDDKDRDTTCSRTLSSAADNDNDNEWFVCRCSDNRRCRRRRLVLTTPHLKDDEETQPDDVVAAAAAVVEGRTTSNQQEASTSTHSRVLTGTAVVCLTDPDADWFQGYLFVSGSGSSSTYYGLLGRIQELDECLQCADGGYRELTLQVTPMGVNPKKPADTWEFANIAWTGGDMMRLRSTVTTADSSITTTTTTTTATSNSDATTVRMDADRVETGRPAYQRIQALFGSLLRRLRQHAEEPPVGPEEDDPNSNRSSAADLMPNAAVVTGGMELRLPDSGPPK